MNGRATEERPPWGYAKLLADRLGQVGSALDIDTGGGEVLAEVPTFPPLMVATEAWPANAQRARKLLGPRGVQIIETVKDAPDESFELVVRQAPEGVYFTSIKQNGQVVSVMPCVRVEHRGSSSDHRDRHVVEWHQKHRQKVPDP